jgi:hypothetical protein
MTTDSPRNSNSEAKNHIIRPSLLSFPVTASRHRLASGPRFTIERSVEEGGLTELHTTSTVRALQLLSYLMESIQSRSVLVSVNGTKQDTTHRQSWTSETNNQKTSITFQSAINKAGYRVQSARPLSLNRLLQTRCNTKQVTLTHRPSKLNCCRKKSRRRNCLRKHCLPDRSS